MVKGKDLLKKKNHERRHGSTCRECDKKLGKYRLDGPIDGENMVFCSFECIDKYKDSLVA
jgi:hypothetical protein